MRNSIVKSIIIMLCFWMTGGIVALTQGQLLVTRTYTINESAKDRVRVVAIADLHGNARGGKKEQLLKQIQDANPDFIVCLGDMVDRKLVDESIEVLLSLTEMLEKIAPVYYVDGNHEQDVQKTDPEKYTRLIEEMTTLGAIQLDNRLVDVNIGGITVNICGISTHYYWGDEEKALVEDLRNREGINIIACHYPESVVWYKAFSGGGVDVALCGHTHGGLIRIPFKGGVYAPEQGRWPMYDLGEYAIYTDTTWSVYGGEDGSSYLGTMIISGGLAGEHGVPRINNPREISLIEIGDV